jgi:outer membrane cobalamin receptor
LKTPIRRLAAALLAAASTAPSFAAEPPGEMTEVLITSNRLEETLPQQLARFGTRVSTLAREDVLNGAYVDIAQSLQALAPGLYIQPKNGPFDYADISLLGSRTGDVLWLVDGVRINNRLYNGTPPVDTLPANLVSRLEVLEGGQALFYGTDAVAGVVNIVTQPFSATPRGTLSAATDTHDGVHANGTFSTGIGAHRIVVFGSSDETEGYESFRRSDYQPSATDRKREYDLFSLGAKYAYELGETLRMSATYIHTEGDLDFALPYRVSHNVNSRRERIASLKLDYMASEHVSFYLKGYYHQWHTTYDTFYNSLGTPGALETIYDDAFWGYDDRGINALARFNFTRGVDYFIGYDLQRYGGRDEVLVIEQNKEQTQAFFAQVRTGPELLPKTHFTAGLRHNAPDVGASATVWNASGQFDISPSLFVRTTLGTNFRLPTAEELFANDPLNERGNPNLRPERTKNINLSVGGMKVHGTLAFHWELVGFARDITDLIDDSGFDALTQQALFENVPGTVRVRGGQVVLGAERAETLAVNFSFTQNHSLQEGAQISRVPEEVLKTSVDFHPPGRPFGATLAVNHTGDVFTAVDGRRLNYGGYTIVDISGRYFLDAARRHRMSLSLQNALDEEFGRPARGCRDVSGDSPADCSAPYLFVNLGLPRTLRASYTYAF